MRQRAVVNWKKAKKVVSIIRTLKKFEIVQEDGIEKKREIAVDKWDKFVIKYYSKRKLVIDLAVNIAYIISFFLTPYVIAFEMDPLKSLRWLEFALDIVILFNVFISFFSA